jgi:hypothetical protein
LGGIWYGSRRLAQLREYDAPLRKAAIEKATREHEKAEAQKVIDSKQAMIQLARDAGVKVKDPQ